MSKKFERKIEDFTCENCGHTNKGDGYTNHCCKCLWSKHVDNNPGDRAADCGGLMDPSQLDYKGGTYIIHHKCTKCGHIKPNKTNDADDLDAILAISSKSIKQI